MKILITIIIPQKIENHQNIFTKIVIGNIDIEIDTGPDHVQVNCGN